MTEENSSPLSLDVGIVGAGIAGLAAAAALARIGHKVDVCMALALDDLDKITDKRTAL